MSDNQHPTRLTATKAALDFAVWIEVDGREVPIYGVSTPPEGPEGFVLSEFGKQYVIKYAIKPSVKLKPAVHLLFHPLSLNLALTCFLFSPPSLAIRKPNTPIWRSLVASMEEKVLPGAYNMGQS
ncbi:hypothetical protein QFC22_001489 [Naganishia vaughanmartiniae]|uniref:Uncharacterized protein n=1 Tax=Naganishia vaughanmartiniae TaxID=1424756 RepID=A0ACC2XI28_9TREE|nr:hypothetical protein QFC22_001489 [Naganishia vaughanmartiniae]